MVQELVPNISDQRRLFSSITHNPVVQAKCDWCTKWIESSVDGFPTRLVAFSIVEGIFFSSSFAAIFWLRMRGLMPGLVQANVMIARDEGTHVQFACLLYKLLHATVPKDVVYGMVDEAVRIEIAFFGGTHSIILAYSFIDSFASRTAASPHRHELRSHGRLRAAYRRRSSHESRVPCPLRQA